MIDIVVNILSSLNVTLSRVNVFYTHPGNFASLGLKNCKNDFHKIIRPNGWVFGALNGNPHETTGYTIIFGKEVLLMFYKINKDILTNVFTDIQCA